MRRVFREHGPDPTGASRPMTIQPIDEARPSGAHGPEDCDDCCVLHTPASLAPQRAHPRRPAPEREPGVPVPAHGRARVRRRADGVHRGGHPGAGRRAGDAAAGQGGEAGRGRARRGGGAVQARLALAPPGTGLVLMHARYAQARPRSAQGSNGRTVVRSARPPYKGGRTTTLVRPLRDGGVRSAQILCVSPPGWCRGPDRPDDLAAGAPDLMTCR